MKNSSLRNALLIAYHFPPMGGSGVQRSLKLARYLPQAGWRPHVVCAGHEHYPLVDATLVGDAGPVARIHRTLGWEPGGIAATIGGHLAPFNESPGAWARKLENRLCWRLDSLIAGAHLPERELLWVPSAIRMAKRVAKRHSIEAVVTSGPPHSSHLVGRALKRRLGLPWLTDLRDPILDNWATCGTTRPSSRFFRWLDEILVREADHIVVTCREVIEAMQARHPELDSERLSCIPNGFDPADAPRCERPLQSKRFILAHVGAFYRDQSVEPILLALRRIWTEYPETYGRMELRLIGSLSAPQRRLLREDDGVFLNDVGYLPHLQAIEEMAAANLLILMTPTNDAGRFCVPAKTFEYLAFGGHILAMVHSGTHLASILRHAGNTTVLEGWDVEAVAVAIRDRFEHWRRGTPEPPRDRSWVAQFQRDMQARQFARLIERVCCGAPMTRFRMNKSEEALS